MILILLHLFVFNRYGHPYDRPIFSSLIPSDIFIQIVQSYLTLAYENIKPKKDWEWKDLIEFNKILIPKIDIWSNTDINSLSISQ